MIFLADEQALLGVIEYTAFKLAGERLGSRQLRRDPFADRVSERSQHALVHDGLGIACGHARVAADPGLSVLKTDSLDLGPDGLADPGDPIFYSIFVTNTGSLHSKP